MVAVAKKDKVSSEDIDGKIDVKDNTSSSVTVTWDLNDDGAAEKMKLHIGGTKAVSDDFHDIVGGLINVNKRANDVADLLEAVLLGNVDGVTLANLTSDSFSFELTNSAGITDVLTIKGTAAAAVIADLDGSGIQAIGDTASSFNIIESGEEVLNGAPSEVQYLSDGEISNKGGKNGPAEMQAVLEAAIDPTNSDVTLLGLEEDEFTVQIFSDDKKGDEQVDTFIFKDDEDKTTVADAIDAVASPSAILNDNGVSKNGKNTGTEVVFVEDLGEGNPSVLVNPIKGSETRDEFTNKIKETQLEDLIAFASESDEVSAYDQGDSTLIIVDSGKSPDYIIVPDEDMYL